MKKIYLGLLVVLATFFTSCEFSETIYINDDGSGKVSYYLDGSELMQMMGSQMTGGREESIDSMISFKDIFRKGNLNLSKLSNDDQKKIKSLEKLNMHMVMDTKKSKFTFDIFANFKSIRDMQSMFGAMNSLNKLAQDSKVMGSKNPLSSIDPDKLTKMEYSFNNNVFKRSFQVLDKKLLDSLKQNMGQAEMLFAASTYKLNYHFPKKIKSVSVKDAVIGEDGKSFTVKINAMEFVNNPEILNLEVELEK